VSSPVEQSGGANDPQRRSARQGGSLELTDQSVSASPRRAGLGLRGGRATLQSLHIPGLAVTTDSRRSSRILRQLIKNGAAPPGLKASAAELIIHIPFSAPRRAFSSLGIIRAHRGIRFHGPYLCAGFPKGSIHRLQQ